MTRLSSALLATAVMTLSTAAFAETPERNGQLRLTPAQITALPTINAGTGTSGVAGIRTTIIAGNPNAAGPYTIALRVPANTRIAAHWHRDARSAVVMSGTWYFGYGDKADYGTATALGPGSFYTEPASVPHFARTSADAVVVYITGTGPTDTHYVDVSNEPRR